MRASFCSVGNSQLNRKHVSAAPKCIGFDRSESLISTNGRSFYETQAMKTKIQLFAIVIAFLSVTVSPQARAVCQQGCDTGNQNTFLGEDALISNTTGINNTAIGENALYSNTTGYENTAIGSFALSSNTGNSNTAMGSGALTFNTTGAANTAIGNWALHYTTTGSSNIALGNLTGWKQSTGSNNIYISNEGVFGGESNSIRIGSMDTHTNTFIAGISGATVPNGLGVVIDRRGHLGTTTSSERFKDAIRPMDNASEAILTLKPVTFRYKKELDPKGIPQFGLVAEEVEKVNPDLVARDDQGKPYTVRYEAVNAMLLNEFLKEHRKVEQLEATVANLVTTVREQASEMRKARTQLELSKPAPQTVLNN
jgi:Chaperone of endosialidase